MPMYDFKCQDCGSEFEEIVRIGVSETSCNRCNGVAKRSEVPAKVGLVFSAASSNTPFDSKVGKVAEYRKQQNAIRKAKKDSLIRKHKIDNPDATLCSDGNNYIVTKPDGSIVDKSE